MLSALNNNFLAKPKVQLGLAASSGLLYFLAFAPYNYWPLLLISLSGLVVVLQRATDAKQVLKNSLVWSLCAFFPGFQWVHVSVVEHSATPEPIAWILVGLLALVTGLIPSLTFWLWRKAVIRWRCIPLMYESSVLIFPLLFMLAELMRSWIFTGFPWLLAGTALLESPLSAWLPVVSSFGAGFVVAVVAVLALELICKPQRVRSASLVAMLVLTTALLAQINWVQPTGDSKSVSLVQGNIPQERKWLPEERWPTVDKYLAMTEQEWGRDIIVWPEAAIPVVKHHLEQSGVYHEYQRLAQQHDSTLVLGLLQVAYETGRFYNGIYAIGETQSQYFKRRLVIFGEYVPLEFLFRGLIDFFNLPMSTIVPGIANQNWLQAANTDIAAALCYEIAYPFLVRNNLVKQQGVADVILTVSNDAWFGSSIGPKQHAQIAQIRAKELGRPLLRSTNTGVTLVADHQGRIQAKLPQFTDEVLRSNIQLVKGQTPWAKLGVWSIVGLVLVWCSIVTFAFSITRKSS